MKKNYVLIIFIVLMVMGGCGKKSETVDKMDTTNGQQQQTQGNQLPQWNENFEEANLSDLEAGQQVLVMGTENSDGSISASQIMIGNGENNFENMIRPTRPSTEENSDNQNNENQPTGQPAGSNRGRQNFEQMQNMSDKERAKMREQMMAERGTGGRIRPGNRGSMARLVGEIFDKDESTITLKIDEGGSKLIFYSDETRVLKIKVRVSTRPP